MIDYKVIYNNKEELNEYAERYRKKRIKENHMHLNTFKQRLFIYYKIERRKFLDYLKKKVNDTIKKVQGEI